MDYNVKKSNDIPAPLTITCIILAILIGLFGLFCMKEMKKYDTETSSAGERPVIHVSK